MAHQINNIYTFNDEYKTLLDLSTRNNLNLDPDPATPLNLNNPDQDPGQDNQTPLQLPYWRSSQRLQNLYNRFQDNILAQYSRIACVYYRKLLYPEKASWILYDS